MKPTPAIEYGREWNLIPEPKQTLFEYLKFRLAGGKKPKVLVEVEVKVENKKVNLSKLARKYKINKRTFHSRIRNGLTIEEAIEGPIPMIKYNGEKKSVGAWARLYNIRYDTLYRRLKRGWTFEEAITEKVGNYTKSEI